MDKASFIDSIRIFCQSGNGGSGSAHFLRTKSNPRGGPDGGNGGRGGHIILEGNENMWTLYHLRYQKHLTAKHGNPGSGNCQSGKAGVDIIVQVPVGSLAYDGETKEKEVEVIKHGQRILWIRGGKGGLGNVNFTTAVRQAPSYAQKGEKGEEGWKRIELKILADVGLLGQPNAGKSTLLSTLSSAKPKIASYPFTTLIPQLGIVATRENQSFCMADLPGIIEDAHQGKGLGIRFLRHAERNALIAYVLPITSDNLYENLALVKNELILYKKELLQKKSVAIVTKCDLASEEEIDRKTESLRQNNIPYQCVSAVSSLGISELKRWLWAHLNEAS